jgi:hypothetical protein
MVDVVDIHTRQRVVVEFYAVEDSSPIESHGHPGSIYGEDGMDHFKSRE